MDGYKKELTEDELEGILQYIRGLQQERSGAPGLGRSKGGASPSVDE